VRVVLEGSGFMMTSLVRVDGISVKTRFLGPQRIEFDLPANAIERATPNPYFAPGPFQNNRIHGLSRRFDQRFSTRRPRVGRRTWSSRWCCRSRGAAS